MGSGFICKSVEKPLILPKKPPVCAGKSVLKPQKQIKKAEFEFSTNIESRYANKGAELFPGGLQSGGKKEETPLKGRRGQNIRGECSRSDYNPVKKELQKSPNQTGVKKRCAGTVSREPTDKLVLPPTSVVRFISGVIPKMLHRKMSHHMLQHDSERYSST